MPGHIRIKICCITSVEEALLAINQGADAIGLVGPMPSGPGVISHDEIAEIVKYVPPGVSSFLLTSETEAEAIIQHHQRVNTSVIQLVDAVSTKNCQKIKSALPTVKLVQVIHVLSADSIDEAIQSAKYVDAILLDSGNPNLTVKELGGTGRVHNWDFSQEIVSRLDTPVYLAGGLNPHNVSQAIQKVRPFGIDLCSGVRTNKRLDAEKLEQFFDKVSI